MTRPTRVKTSPPTLFNGHRLEFVEAGEEWDSENELFCKLHKAVCQYCGASANPARTRNGAQRKFEREHIFKRCPGQTQKTKKP